MLRRFIVSLLAISFVLSLSGIAATKKVEVKYWQSVGYLEVAETFIQTFEAKYPDIKIKFEGIPTRSIVEKVMLAVAADDLPNIVFDYNGRLCKWKFEGVTLPLQDTLTEEEKADFVPGMLEMHTIDGDLFMYPAIYGPLGYALNKTLLDEAGISLPGSSFTLEKWEEIAEKVSNPPDIYAGIFHANGRGGDYWMLQYFQAFGAKQYEDQDYTHTTLNSEAGVKALEWMLKVRDRGWVPPGVAAITSSIAAEYKIGGKIAMFGAGPAWSQKPWWENLVEQARAPRIHEVVMSEIPHFKEVSLPGWFVGTDGMAVFKEKDPDVLAAAFKLAKFVFEPDITSLISKYYNMIPCRQSIDVPLIHVPAYQRCVQLMAELGVADQGINSPFYVEVRDLRYPEFQAAFMGKKTPQEALDDFAKAVADLWK